MKIISIENKSLGRRFQKHYADLAKLVMLEIVKKAEDWKMLQMTRTLFQKKKSKNFSAAIGIKPQYE